MSSYYVKFIKKDWGVAARKLNCTNENPRPSVALSRKADRKVMVPCDGFQPEENSGWLVHVVAERERSYLVEPVAGPFICEQWSQSIPSSWQSAIVARSCYHSGRAGLGSASEGGIAFLDPSLYKPQKRQAFPAGTFARCSRCGKQYPLPKEVEAVERKTEWAIMEFMKLGCQHFGIHFIDL